MSRPDADVRRIVLRITSGARSHEVEEIPIRDATEVVFGRDNDVDVKFDQNLDDLVSRRHARIAVSGEEYTLEDLGSSNGTLVNGTRITGSVRLEPGDTLELGAGGPKVVFELEPRIDAPPRTRLAPAGRPVIEPTAGPLTTLEPAGPVSVAGSMPVGRGTVERLVATSEKRSRQRFQLVALALAVVAVVAAVLFYASRRETRREIDAATTSQALTPVEIADHYRFSTVFIASAWTLVHTHTGEELYHRYRQDPKSKRWLPAYIELVDGRIEPWLWAGAENGNNAKITNSLRASGFVVKDDGFILTNRHVAAPWRSDYDLILPGLLYGWDTQKGELVKTGELTEQDAYRLPSHWVPAEAAFVGDTSVSGKLVDGRHIFLDVTFPKDTLRIPARLVRESDEHDVALIKIDLPNRVTPVPLYDSYDEIRIGQEVTLLGYPSISPDVGMLVGSQDALDRSGKWRQIPDPSLNVGVISRVIRGSVAPAAQEQGAYWSRFGDAYQLTVDTAGPGNSGGPVFDDQGRVIGLFTYGRTVEETTVTFAVPIRYGEALMKISPVVD